jgi:poly(3-hydroxybutyrate) depolymerase
MNARLSVLVGFCATSLAAIGCSSKNNDAGLFPSRGAGATAGASAAGASSGGAGASTGGASSAGDAGAVTSGGSSGVAGAATSGAAGNSASGAAGDTAGGASGSSAGSAGAGTSGGGSSAGGASGAAGAAGAAGSAGAAGMAGSAPTTGCNAASWPPGGASAPQMVDVIDNTGVSMSRQFYISLPTGYDPAKAYPLVTVWHYAGGTATQMISAGPGGAFYGVQKGFPNAIYVAGQGLTDSMGQTGWPNTKNQDVAFTRAMLAWLEQSYCIDQNRIMATGMSYGGIMSNTLACQMPDVFRATGVMSGALFNFQGGGCVDHPIASWITHGTADMTVTFASGQTARDQYLKDNGCGTTSTPVDPAPCVSYDGCKSGYPVVWCPVDGEGHTIPSFAAGAIANFFKGF